MKQFKICTCVQSCTISLQAVASWWLPIYVGAILWLKVCSTVVRIKACKKDAWNANTPIFRTTRSIQLPRLTKQGSNNDRENCGLTPWLNSDAWNHGHPVIKHAQTTAVKNVYPNGLPLMFLMVPLLPSTLHMPQKSHNHKRDSNGVGLTRLEAGPPMGKNKYLVIGKRIAKRCRCNLNAHASILVLCSCAIVNVTIDISAHVCKKNPNICLGIASILLPLESHSVLPERTNMSVEPMFLSKMTDKKHK